MKLLMIIVIYVANVGDTRAVLWSGTSVQRLSYDHKSIDLEEQKRVKSKGGDIINDRVMGILAITRAFGDFNLKSKGVTVEPQIKRLKIPKDTILVMASDGIWDVIDDQVLTLLKEIFRIMQQIKYH